MNNNLGKKLYTSYEDAEKAASSMRRSKNEPFNVYKVDDGWEVGGAFLKPSKKVKSLSDLKNILDLLKTSEDDSSVDEYIGLIQYEERSEKISTTFGTDQIWRLISYSEKTGLELNMKNSNNYLVLEISNGTDTKNPKMGGAFEPHIPLMKKIAESLIGQPILWHTWNPKSDPTKWGNSSWFYRIEECEIGA